MSVMIQSMVRVVQDQPPAYKTTSPTTNKRARVASHGHGSASPASTLQRSSVDEKRVPSDAGIHSTSKVSVEDYISDVRLQFSAPTEINRLLAYSAQLQAECRERLQSSTQSMLPSYQYALPTGKEKGDYLALDVGGSTFRLALVRLAGSQSQAADQSTDKRMQIRGTRKFEINEDTRRLQGQAFFDWMAARIEDMLQDHGNRDSEEPLGMGLAWSFPIEQTSPRSGKVITMGKGFCATNGVEGGDLSELIMKSCRARNLPVVMKAIVNDGTATLLSQAYLDSTTRMSLILGTGTNACVLLPVKALAASKYGSRPAEWYQAAEHVLVNTELSMVGKNILPTTRWDDHLNATHTIPDYQPLEYLTTGRYLGEIVRLILLDAIAVTGIFSGQVPSGLDVPYSLDTRLLAAFEAQTPCSLDSAIQEFTQTHRPSSPVSRADWLCLQEIIRAVSHRASAYLSAALHALWRVRTENACDNSVDSITVACHGTIIEKYPGYRQRCQSILDALCMADASTSLTDSTVQPPKPITLAVAPESSIFGAAVAVGCLED